MPTIAINARMEAYSRAWVHAIAAGAGVATGNITPDINGLDVHFLSLDDGDDAGSCAHVQLKSTAETLPTADDGAKRYMLRHIDYDRLRKPTTVPRLLVVLEVPANPEDWLSCQPVRLLMNASARWVSLRGWDAPTYASSSKIPIALPATNLFTPTALVSNLASLDEKMTGQST